MHEESQARAAAEQNYQEVAAQLENFQQQETAQQYDPNADPFLAGYEQAMEVGDYRTALALQSQLTAAAVQQGLKQFAETQQQQTQPQIAAHYNNVAFNADQLLGQKYQDWGEIKGRIAETIQQFPYLVPEEALVSPLATADALERVYKMVKADDPSSGAAQQQAAAGLAARQAADLAPNNAGRIQSPEEAKAEWDAIRAAGSQSPWTR